MRDTYIPCIRVFHYTGHLIMAHSEETETVKLQSVIVMSITLNIVEYLVVMKSHW